MDLIVNEVVQFQIVHITNSNGTVELFARSAVRKLRLAVRSPRKFREVQTRGVFTQQLVLLFSRLVIQRADILLVSAVEYGSCDLPAQRFRNIAQVNFKHLSDVHT